MLHRSLSHNNAEQASHGLSRRNFIHQTAGATVAAAALAPLSSALAQDTGKTVTLSFVGCAHIHTPQFVKLVKGRPDVKIKSVWDHDAERAERNAKALGCPVVANPEAIWSDQEVSAVVICSETNRHLELVLAGAKAKKHMFVEKPLGITALDSKKMAIAISLSGKHFTTGYFMRTNPAHIFLKEQVAAGTFGKITRARGSNCHSGSLGGWFDKEWRWMADPTQSGVGGFGDLGTHSLDILMWLFGDVESITADIRVITGRYGDCDESGEAMMKFKSGVLATLAAGWVDVDDPVTLLISGTEGHALINKGKLYIKSKKLGSDGVEPWAQLPKAPVLPLNQFVDAVAGQKDLPLVTPAEAAARVCVMEAAYKANVSRKWETVMA